MKSWKEYARRLWAISAYRDFLFLPPVQMLQTLVEGLAQDAPDGDELICHYAETFFELQKAGYDSLGEYLWEHLRYDETPYGDAAARGTASASLTAAARQDIETLAELASFGAAEWKGAVAAVVGADAAALLPEWRGDDTLNFAALNAEYKKNGAGEFARYKAFIWADHTLLPVPDPDLEEHELI